MRKLAIAFVVLGMALAAIPALAVTPPAPAATDEAYFGLPNAGGRTSTNDCPGGIVWDAGMFDEFVPPTGASSAYSSLCFNHALDLSSVPCPAYPCEPRKMADEFEVTVPTRITGLKMWARYSASGNHYHMYQDSLGIRTLWGFCVKIWEQDNTNVLCPDGTVPGEGAIGPLAYEGYVDSLSFTEHMITTGTLLRNWNYCLTLPNAFVAQPGKVYYISASPDFDFVGWTVPPNPAGATQFFTRMYSDPSPADDYTPYCMGSVYQEGPWGNLVTQNWNSIDAIAPTALWPGWNIGFVVYGNPVVQGACCDVLGQCTLTLEAECLPPNVWNGAPACLPQNPCPAVPTESKSWGQIKNTYK